jgi:hypothetical protein
MSDPKSKLPDFQEVSTMVSKFFKDVKTSLGEIIVEYRKKRKDQPASKSTAHKPAAKPHTTSTKAATEEKSVKAKPKKPKEDDSKSHKD